LAFWVLLGSALAVGWVFGVTEVFGRDEEDGPLIAMLKTPQTQLRFQI
jgi:hypothetical protein